MNDPLQQSFVQSHFLDSGAFSLSGDVEKFRSDHPGATAEDFYDLQRFKPYLDRYARVIRHYRLAVDYYANVDVIHHPELSWRNLKYLENEHGLNPIPVIHAGTDLRWLRRHLKHEYRMLAIGGLVGRHKMPAVRQWLDEFFRMMCPMPQCTPLVRTHAFGAMAGPLLFRYPFWSADATNVGKLGWYGKIIVPRKTRDGAAYDYSSPAYIVALSAKAVGHRLNIHSRTIPWIVKEQVREWLDFINASGFYNRPLLLGDTSEDYMAANYFFYQQIRDHLPPLPGRFEPERYTGGLLWPPDQVESPRNSRKIQFFLSGANNGEETLRHLGVKHIGRMLTFYDVYQSPQGIEPLLTIYHERQKLKRALISNGRSRYGQAGNHQGT